MDSEVAVRIRSVKSVKLTEGTSAEETQALCPGCSSFRNISANAVLVADYVKDKCFILLPTVSDTFIFTLTSSSTAIHIHVLFTFCLTEDSSL